MGRAINRRNLSGSNYRISPLNLTRNRKVTIKCIRPATTAIDIKRTVLTPNRRSLETTLSRYQIRNRPVAVLQQLTIGLPLQLPVLSPSIIAGSSTGVTDKGQVKPHNSAQQNH